MTLLQDAGIPSVDKDRCFLFLAQNLKSMR